MANIFDMADTWNDAAQSFTAIKMNVTNTASAAGSLLIDLQVGGGSKFRVTRDGRAESEQLLARSDLAVIGANPVIFFGNGYDVQLHRDAANILAQRNGVNPQRFRLYNTFADAANYERGFLAWGGNTLVIGTEAAGTGIKRNLLISPGGFLYLRASASGAGWFFNGGQHFLAETDNTFDIGANGANRPRNVYVAGHTVSGDFVQGKELLLIDGITAPAAAAGRARIFIDSLDGDLKIIFADGVVKTIVTDV